jgi:hypothetical protein
MLSRLRQWFNTRISEFRFRTSPAHDEGEHALHCPCCGLDYIHIRDIAILQGHTLTHCYQDSVEIHPIPEPADRRGSSIIIRYICEAGHLFSYKQTFWKGMTIFSLHDIQRPVGGVSDYDTLWRN